jgi:very-short-patch-repair endonuclease
MEGRRILLAMDEKALRERARELRKAMTPQEVKLWSDLKHFNARGFHFRRQAVLDGYVLDFAAFGKS